MTPELTILTLAALLQVVQFTIMAIAANLEIGPGKTTSPRDYDRLGGTVETLLSNKPARLVRAFNNHNEALILFTIAALTIHLTGQSTLFTAICTYSYLAARILYIPAYYYGWQPWRSFIWFAGLIATTLMLLAALL